MKNTQELPRPFMVLIALVQGLVLLALHLATEHNLLQKEHASWVLLMYTVALVLPTMLLLSVNSVNLKRISIYTVPFALVCGALGYYLGSQVSPAGGISTVGLIFVYSFTLSLATFKALIYIQQRVSGGSFSYSNLFSWSWRNFLTLVLAGFFSSAFWLVLFLWGQLFDAIGIEFFKDLFDQPWFYYPVMALANGFGIIIFRQLSQVIDTIKRLQQALMKFLLILLVLVSMLFLTALPWTGLEPLWKGGGSTLILWLQALILFSVNVVYQDVAAKRPYSLWLHRFVYIGIALLPIYSAISFYGLSLRVDQYGWTLSRCWGFVVWFFLAVFPLGYLWGIAKHRDNWLGQLSRVNVAVGLVFLGAMLLVNSPFLDFRKIVVSNHLDRLKSKQVQLDEFDVDYFYRSLGAPGFEALKQIKEIYADSNPQIVLRINALSERSDHDQPHSSQEEFEAAVSDFSGNAPAELMDAIYQEESGYLSGSMAPSMYYLQSIDLDNDSQLEYVFAKVQYERLFIKLFYFEADQWKFVRFGPDVDASGQAGELLIEQLKSGDLPISKPRWNHFQMGETKFMVDEAQ